MNLLFSLAAFGEGLWIIPLLTFTAGVFFFVKGYYEQKAFHSLDAKSKVAPFWWYAPTIAGAILIVATGVIIWAINYEW